MNINTMIYEHDKEYRMKCKRTLRTRVVRVRSTVATTREKDGICQSEGADWPSKNRKGPS